MNKDILFANTHPGMVEGSKRFVFDRELLEKLVFEWIRRMIFYSQFRLTNSVIQSMAIQFKTVLRMDWFFPTKEWLTKFRYKYELNAENTKVFSFGCKEGKSVQVRDIIRDLLLQKNLERESGKGKPVVQIIEIDDDEPEERYEIIEIEDDQPIHDKPLVINEPLIMDDTFFADELEKFDELLNAGKISVVNDITRADEQLAADSVSFSDELLVTDKAINTQETSETDSFKAMWDFVDIEDQLPRSVCTRFGSTVVQKEQPRINTQGVDLEELIPTSVCTGHKIPENEIESAHTPDGSGLHDNVLLYTDMPKFEISRPIEILSRTTANTDEKETLFVWNFKKRMDSVSSAVKTKKTVSTTAKRRNAKGKTRRPIRQISPSKPLVFVAPAKYHGPGFKKLNESKNVKPNPIPPKPMATSPSLFFVTDPSITSEPAGHITTPPVTAMPITTAPATALPITITPITTTHTTTSPITITPITATPITTTPITITPITTSPITTTHITTTPITATPITTTPITITPITITFTTTPSLTTAPINTAPATVVPITAATLTAATMTAAPITAPLITAPRINAQPTTVPPITTPPITAAPATKYYSHRHAQNMLELNHKIPITTSISRRNNTTKPVPTTPKKQSTISRRKPLKTRDEALKCIKLMEEFALMKENFLLIGYIERLEKLI